MSGFSWSFYGFFLFAALWIAAYFAWAWWASRPTPGTRGPKPEA